MHVYLVFTEPDDQGLYFNDYVHFNVISNAFKNFILTEDHIDGEEFKNSTT